jgi:hypothetical protein
MKDIKIKDKETLHDAPALVTLFPQPLPALKVEAKSTPSGSSFGVFGQIMLQLSFRNKTETRATKL